MNAFQLTPRPIYQPDPPARDPKYLTFLRRLCCVVCGAFRWVEAAHFGPRGMGQKASDYDALPLCRRCHRTGVGSYHELGARRFVEVHSLNVQLHQRQCRAGYRRTLTLAEAKAFGARWYAAVTTETEDRK